MHSHIKTANRIGDILSFFRAVNSVFLELLKIPDTPQDFAIDFHNEGYYGDKNAEGVRGIQTAEEWHVLGVRLFYPRLAGGSNAHP